jgi:hypothetical protein
MSSRRLLPAVLAGLALAVLLGGTAPAADRDTALDDLLFDLQLVPMTGQAPPPLELERMRAGRLVTLEEHRGQPVLLYFWASW